MQKLLCFLALAIASHLQAQNNYITSMKVTQDRDLIIIEYDLQKINLDLYYYTVDLEVIAEGQTIYPSPNCLSGDISGVSDQHFIPGDLKKRISWTPLREPALQELKGDVSFRLRAKLYSKVYGGPESAFLSLLIPGIGHYKVERKKGPYFLIGTVGYALVGTGIYYRTQYNTYYNNYLTSQNPQEIVALRNQYKSNLKKSNLLLLGGGAVWIGDFAWVALKGRHNKKLYQRLTVYPSIYFGDKYGASLVFGVNF